MNKNKLSLLVIGGVTAATTAVSQAADLVLSAPSDSIVFTGWAGYLVAIVGAAALVAIAPWGVKYGIRTLKQMLGKA